MRCFPGRGTQPSWRQNLAHSLDHDVSDIAFARQRKLSQQLPWRLFRAERNHWPTMGVLAILAAQILRPTYSTSSRHGRTGKGRLRRAGRADGFLQVERRIATLLQLLAGDTPASTVLRLMHRKPLTIDR